MAKKKNIMKKVIYPIKENKEWQLFICLFLIIITSFLFFKPIIAGDGLDYVQAMDFLNNGIKDENFSPNRLLTTFGSLQIIIFLSKIFFSVNFSWIFVNTLLYFLACYFFYKTILAVHEDKNIAIISTLFLAGNYALVVFGLNFLMDMGGWFFYILTLYFSICYLKSGGERKHLLLASLSTGVGLLFKEYAVLGVVPIAVIIIFENFNKSNIFDSIYNIFRKSLIPAFLAVTPILLVYIYIYFKFEYTYIDWLQTNHERYGSFNKIVEYIKSFGSLLNILGILFIFGFYAIFQKWKELSLEIKIFILASFVSVLPVFLWPGITQRVLFVSVPAIIIASSFFIKKFEKHNKYFVILFLLYFLISLYMDSFILKFINLPF